MTSILSALDAARDEPSNADSSVSVRPYRFAWYTNYQGTGRDTPVVEGAATGRGGAGLMHIAAKSSDILFHSEPSNSWNSNPDLCDVHISDSYRYKLTHQAETNAFTHTINVPVYLQMIDVLVQ